MKILLCWSAGPLVKYDPESELLHIADLNPEIRTQWRMGRYELLAFGWRCIKAALGRGP